MAIAEHESGSQTATIGTEHTLGTDNDATDGSFQHCVDLINMVRGDEVEIRIYGKTRAADTIGQVHIFKRKHAQTNKVFKAPWIGEIHARRFTLKQTVGTGRAFPWSVLRIP